MTAGGAAVDQGWLPTPATLTAFTAYAVVAASLAPYSWPMRVGTGAVCAAVAVDAVRRGWFYSWPSSTAKTGGAGPALVVWLALIAAVVVVQLGLYVASPREVYPTLSSLAGDAFAVWPVRAVGFAFWSWVGWYVVRR